MSHNPPHAASLSPDTTAVAVGRPTWVDGAPTNPPITLASAFVSRGTPGAGAPVYARDDNPSFHGAEELIGALTGSPCPAVVFASGMAAIDAALSIIPPGGRLVMPTHGYQVGRVLAKELSHLGRIRLSLVPINDTDAVIEALKGGNGAAPASMLWIETPTNPLLEIADAEALVTAAHELGAVVAVDNTIATPLSQRPLQWGADLEIHSATKYLSGHSDVILGAAVASSKDLDQTLRSFRSVHGTVPGPFEAWLVLRGMRTLALRMNRIQESAATLARRLEAHTAVEKVRHPSLPSDPGHVVAKSQMLGFGGMISVEVRGGAKAADAVVEHVRLWVPATSLGGVESSLERRRRFPTESVDVPENLLRLSVGIENVDDLWEDLNEALFRAVS